MKTGIELIAAERKRQETEEHWSPGHDDDHEYAELRRAAEAYLWEIRARQDRLRPEEVRRKPLNNPPPIWPWDKSDFKPTEDIVRQLVKAGALIAAEIDRLQRARLDSGPPPANKAGA